MLVGGTKIISRKKEEFIHIRCIGQFPRPNLPSQLHFGRWPIQSFPFSSILLRRIGLVNVLHIPFIRFCRNLFFFAREWMPNFFHFPFPSIHFFPFPKNPIKIAVGIPQKYFISIKFPQGISFLYKFAFHLFLPIFC